jgi:hypothetical protein
MVSVTRQQLGRKKINHKNMLREYPFDGESF